MMDTKSREILVQRVATVFALFPECADNDTALIFRVAMLYGASSGMDVERSLTFPSATMIKRTATKVRNGNHGSR